MSHLYQVIWRGRKISKDVITYDSDFFQGFLDFSEPKIAAEQQSLPRCSNLNDELNCWLCKTRCESSFHTALGINGSSETRLRQCVLTDASMATGVLCSLKLTQTNRIYQSQTMSTTL